MTLQRVSMWTESVGKRLYASIEEHATVKAQMHRVAQDMQIVVTDCGQRRRYLLL